MIHLLTIVGARPQFIKAAAISHAIREEFADSISEDILHTGQHYDRNMSDGFFDELDIPHPRYNLGVGSGTHGAQTAAMLRGIEEVLLSAHYDGVVVYGDTNSTLAGALAAAKVGVPVFHIEAGLRSFNRAMPEEVNRVLTDHLSTLLFAPTATAVENLRREGFDEGMVIHCGDVMLDNVSHYLPCCERYSSLTLPEGPFIFATLHRDFNTDSRERLENILSGLYAAARRLGAAVLMPLHPRTRQRLGNFHITLDDTVLHTVGPLSYLSTLHALSRCQLVMTDSGGLQKEAYFCGRPVVVLRPETEWVEIVEAGAAILADAAPDRIVAAAERLWNTTPVLCGDFGDGAAASTILKHIILHFGHRGDASKRPADGQRMASGA